MVTDSMVRRPLLPQPTRLHEIMPDPERIRAMAAEIRKTWSPLERRRRIIVAHYMLLRQLIATEW